MLKTLTQAVERVCLTLTVALFVVMLGAVLLQVVARYALPSAPVWTEELTRFLLIYLVAFACGLAARRRELVNVDLVVNLLPRSLRRGLLALVDLLVIAFCLVFLVQSVEYVKHSALQTATTLPLSMAWITAAVLVIAASLAFFTLLGLLDLLGGARREHR
ncbi:MAG TPA: TRAP transporter small permease [Candidatus Competibacteraceae bacterium]|nr:TRAP transporter small permease [Candidatus Competibacteraceae bacterium]